MPAAVVDFVDFGPTIREFDGKARSVVSAATEVAAEPEMAKDASSERDMSYRICCVDKVIEGRVNNQI